jgi:hypothetical protein
MCFESRNHQNWDNTGWVLLMVEVSITFIATGFWAQEMFEL